MHNPIKKVMSLDSSRATSVREKAESSKQTINPKYTQSMAKGLIMEGCMTTRAQELYQARVQISAANFNVILFSAENYGIRIQSYIHFGCRRLKYSWQRRSQKRFSGKVTKIQRLQTKWAEKSRKSWSNLLKKHQKSLKTIIHSSRNEKVFSRLRKNSSKMPNIIFNKLQRNSNNDDK